MIISILQYGAIGLGLAVLAYTAIVLKQELARQKPRPEGRNLILIFMAFSFVAFGILTYLENVDHQKQIDAMNVDRQNLIDAMNVDRQKQIAEIGNLVNNIDANLGSKYQSAVNDIPSSLSKIKETLKNYENQVCQDVKALKKSLYGKEESQCVLPNIRRLTQH
jgi:hypothetical protein